MAKHIDLTGRKAKSKHEILVPSATQRATEPLRRVGELTTEEAVLKAERVAERVAAETTAFVSGATKGLVGGTFGIVKGLLKGAPAAISPARLQLSRLKGQKLEPVVIGRLLSARPKGGASVLHVELFEDLEGNAFEEETTTAFTTHGAEEATLTIHGAPATVIVIPVVDDKTGRVYGHVAVDPESEHVYRIDITE